jgi:hypothetical protein
MGRVRVWGGSTRTQTLRVPSLVPGKRRVHACGLRQGDPISPLLFVIAMEALTKLVDKATELGVISSYSGISAIPRLSIYADDVALFIKPSIQDLASVRTMLEAFGEASCGLITKNLLAF